MARVLGYGGIANTNGARTFSGKAAAVEETFNYGHTMHRRARGYRILIPFVLLELMRRWF